MIVENRILVQLIDNLKPTRILSIHSHLRKERPDRRGNEPGVFVDPRGGFDAHTDQAYTDVGQLDDELCREMLASARGGIQNHNLPVDDPDGDLHESRADPLRGNLTVKKGGKFVEAVQLSDATLHHSCAAAHDPGTSLGDWAPESQKVDDRSRQGAPVITLELPRGYKEERDLNNIWITTVRDVGGIART